MLAFQILQSAPNDFRLNFRHEQCSMYAVPGTVSFKFSLVTLYGQSPDLEHV